MTQSSVLRPPSSPLLVECPRDSWQGFTRFIPTSEKIAYLKLLIDAGFTQIDFGSFVSPQAVPQMRDTEDVWQALRDYKKGITFIAIVANERGLDRALAAGGLSAIGYPFSISDTFQKNNTGKSITDSWPVLTALQKRAMAAGIDLHVYLSMGFGNPYGEPWNVALITETLKRFRDLGVGTAVLADTVGRAEPEQIRSVVAASRDQLPDFPLGAHLHAAPQNWQANVAAALDAGCARIDSALGGIGGCPFAQDELVANVPTEGVLSLLRERNLSATPDTSLVASALQEAKQLQRNYQ